MFPSTASEFEMISENNSFSQHSSCSIRDKVVTVEAPIDVVDIVKGLREVAECGKPSISNFILLKYDNEKDTSLVKCTPITG